MSDDALDQDLAAQAAPEQETTAAPETDVDTPDDASTEAAKVFTQEEVDAIVAKRLAREERKRQREQTVEPRAATPTDTPLSPDDFESVEAYAEALAERKLAERQQKAEQTKLRAAYSEREEEARDKYDDFEQVAYNPSLTVTDAMAAAILASELGPEVLYHLGSNPKEAARIADLHPIAQAKEIGKLEARLTGAPPARKTSTAPPPIAPVSARATGAKVYDTTDPRSVEKMSTADWIAADRARQRKLLEAKLK